MPISVIIAAAVTAGVAAGVFIEGFPLGPTRWAVAIFGLLWFVMAARGRIAIARWCFAAALTAGAVLIAADAQERALHSSVRQYLEDRLGGFAIEGIAAGRNETPIQIEGVLLADASLSEAGANLRVRIDRVAIDAWPDPAIGGASLTVVGAPAADAVEQWRAGRTIRAPAVLRRPARYLDAGVPDMERMLARRGVSVVGTIKSAALVQVVRRGSFVDEAAAELRANVRRAIQRHVGVHQAQSAAIALAILIGDRGSLDPIVEQRLQQAGTYHVIAISGGNIAILAGVVIALLWLAHIRDGWASGAVMAVLAAYAYVAGGGPSVVRATVMAALYLGLRMIDQRTAPLHAMSLTLAAVLLATPLAIADVGLWLTFGATAAIVAGAPLLRLPDHRWLRAPVTLLTASMAAEIVLMPVSALVFQRVTIAGLAANLGAIPAMGVAQIAAMVTAAGDALGFTRVARVAGWITHISIRALLGSSALVDVAPWLTWRVPAPAMIVVVGYYACLVAAMIRVRRNRPALMAAALLIWIIAAPQTWSRVFGDGSLHLTMMDVGQGDAILVTLPNGRTLMVDSGGVAQSGEFDVGDRVLGPALRYRGIRRLDYLAITHGDHDHIGGAMSLVRDFDPREIWYGTYVNNHAPSMRLQSMAVYKRTAWRWLLAGDRLELGGVEMRVHHPAGEDWQRQKVRNDDSIVLELRFGQVSVLMTGDISREVEAGLIQSLDLLPIVVLKSPHHGSGSSSSQEFIEKLRPRFVLISCGRGNPFGHPQPYVVQRYRDVGAEVFRTDLDGQVELITDGQSVRATEFTKHAEAHDGSSVNTKGGSHAQ